MLLNEVARAFDRFLCEIGQTDFERFVDQLERARHERSADFSREKLFI